MLKLIFLRVESKYILNISNSLILIQADIFFLSLPHEGCSREGNKMSKYVKIYQKFAKHILAISFYIF